MILLSPQLKGSPVPCCKVSLTFLSFSIIRLEKFQFVREYSLNTLVPNGRGTTFSLKYHHLSHDCYLNDFKTISWTVSTCKFWHWEHLLWPMNKRDNLLTIYECSWPKNTDLGLIKYHVPTRREFHELYMVTNKESHK